MDCHICRKHRFECRQHRHDNQSCEILKWHSAVTYKSRISKVLKVTIAELHIQSVQTHRECHQLAHAEYDLRNKT